MTRNAVPARVIKESPVGLLVALVIAVVGCRSAAQGPEAGSPDGTPLEPVGPDVRGWTETSIDGVICRHPPVVADCMDGWCKIPAGCFIMGSPETEPWRGRYTERLTAVTLTHAFEIAQFEMTRRKWSELVRVTPEKPPAVIESPATCTDPDCPLRYVTWFEALLFANLLSQRHEPPLVPCYELLTCQGELGRGATCPSVGITAPTVYDCEGYRLPTEAEWEYAARAGTRTAYYAGDITVAPDRATNPNEQYAPEPNLESIAWYKNNSGDRTHPVGQKRPNRWMLFDTLGNVHEWTNDQVMPNDSPGPLADPATEIRLTTKYAQDTRVTKGGPASGARDMLRVASRLYSNSDGLWAGVGFRLVRTLK